MLNQKCIKTIFEPQELYTRTALRQLFEQITNSSVMRLTKERLKMFFLINKFF